MSFDPDIVMLAWSLGATSVAAWYDLRTGLIPNRLVAATLTIGVVASLGLTFARGLEHVPFAALKAVFGALVCGLIPLVLYVLKGLGGGDLKLLIAVGACLGPMLGFQAQVYAFAAASLFAFGRAAYDGTLLRTLLASATVLTQPLVPRKFRKPPPDGGMRELRFAPAIFTGVAVSAVAHLVTP